MRRVEEGWIRELLGDKEEGLIDMAPQRRLAQQVEELLS
jgi:hypothetical protein